MGSFLHTDGTDFRSALSTGRPSRVGSGFGRLSTANQTQLATAEFHSRSHDAVIAFTMQLAGDPDARARGRFQGAVSFYSHHVVLPAKRNFIDGLKVSVCNSETTFLLCKTQSQPFNHYDPRQIHYSYRYSLRVLCSFNFKCGHDPRWNGARCKDRQFHFIAGSSG